MRKVYKKLSPEQLAEGAVFTSTLSKARYEQKGEYAHIYRIVWILKDRNVLDTYRFATKSEAETFAGIARMDDLGNEINDHLVVEEE